MRIGGGSTATRRSRRKQRPIGLGWWIAAAAILLFTTLLRAGAGPAMGLGLLAAAVVYGRWAASGQRLDRRRWSDVEALHRLTGVEFEHHVAETYRRLGYQTEVTRGSGDQGADVIATRGRERIAIQCKQWADPVGNDAVQQALAGKGYYRCTDGLVITTSRFTASAGDLAQRVGVRLVDGERYAAMMQSARAEPDRHPWLPSGRPLLYQVGLAAAGVVALAVAYAPAPAPVPEAIAGAPSAPACSVYPATAGMAYYAYDGQDLLAPSGGSCRVDSGPESTALWVTTAAGTVTLEAAPGCPACVTSGSTPPAEQVVRLGPNSLAFEDPPGVAGRGVPSGGADPANGAIVTTPAYAAKETCTMPESDHSLCTLILNTFLRDHAD